MKTNDLANLFRYIFNIILLNINIIYHKNSPFIASSFIFFQKTLVWFANLAANLIYREELYIRWWSWST